MDKLLPDIGKVYDIEGAAEEVARRRRGRRAPERPCTHRPLLSMIDYVAEYGDLTKHWADNARVFRQV